MNTTGEGMEAHSDHCINNNNNSSSSSAGSSRCPTEEGVVGIAPTEQLPTELWELILEALPRGIEDLLSLSLVNHKFHGLASSDRFWRPLGNPAWFNAASDKTCKQRYMEWLRGAVHQYQNFTSSGKLKKAEDTARTRHSLRSKNDVVWRKCGRQNQRNDAAMYRHIQSDSSDHYWHWSTKLLRAIR
eukprot:TRINITY_DN111_c0_g3_i1.p1 TRINITY_DN111_c0_g3~~TRINITY_DN111_c0_g3_i1.p1  ORF type:complete len:187 (-),score=28.88 TRINITY_DN111_c0_g3_i1:182-742(-)